MTTFGSYATKYSCIHIRRVNTPRLWRCWNKLTNRNRRSARSSAEYRRNMAVDHVRRLTCHAAKRRPLRRRVIY
jgi:hypothetical protein